MGSLCISDMYFGSLNVQRFCLFWIDMYGAYTEIWLFRVQKHPKKPQKVKNCFSLCCFVLIVDVVETKKKLTEPANVVQNEHTAFYVLDGIDRDREWDVVLPWTTKEKKFRRPQNDMNVKEQRRRKRDRTSSVKELRNWMFYMKYSLLEITAQKTGPFDFLCKTISTVPSNELKVSLFFSLTKKRAIFFSFFRVSHLFLATPY